MSRDDLLRMAWAQLWQLTAVAIAVVLLVQVFRRKSPHLAHVLWLVVLIKCVTPPVWTSRAGVFCWLQREVSSATTAEALRTPGNSDTSESTMLEATRDDDSSTRFPHPQSANEKISVILPSVPVTSGDQVGRRSAWLWRFLIPGWMFGVASLLGIAAFRWFRCWRSICATSVPSREDLEKSLTELVSRLGISRPVRLLITASRVGPAVVGLWRPTIVLPQAVIQYKDARDLEPILAHELLHVRRGDLWVGMLQVISQSLWWFHPLVWLVNRFLSQDAERCCDEEVIGELGCDPARYARGLLDVLELKRTLQPVPAFPGVRPVEITSRRLERIMKLGQGCHKRTPWWCWMILALISLGTLPGAALVGAGDPPQGTPVPRAIRRDPVVVIYPVKDVLERIQRDLRQSQADAQQTLEQFLRSVGRTKTGDIESQLEWSGRKLVVRSTATGQERIANGIQFVRENGIHQVMFEVHVFSGTSEAIEKLHSHWELLASDVKADDLMAGLGLLDSPPFDALAPAKFAVRQASIAETIEKRQPAVMYDVLNQADANAILNKIRGNSQFSILASPKVITISGQTAVLKTVTQLPFVVGESKTAGKENELHIRYVESGLKMQILPLPQANHQVKLECEIELSNVRNVEERKLIRGSGQKPLTVQVPEVVATRINVGCDIPFGKTLLIGGLGNQSTDGKSTLIMLRCENVTVPVERIEEPAKSEEVVVPGPYSKVEKSPLPRTLPRPNPVREKSIEEKLEAKLSLGTRDGTLKDTLFALFKTTEISIEIDEKGLRAEGVNLNQKTNVKVTDSNAREVLDSLKVGYVVTGDKLIVTGPIKAKSLFFCQSYSVADLLVPIPNTVSVVVDPKTGKESVQTILRKTAIADFRTLIDLIQKTIQPDTWADAGGSGTIESFPTHRSLVVSQTAAIHHEIEDLLTQLRKLQSDGQVSLEAHILGLPQGFVADVGADIPFSPGPKDYLQKDGVASLKIDQGVKLITLAQESGNSIQLPKVTLFRGQTAKIHVGSEELTFVAQVSAIPDPAEGQKHILLQYDFGSGEKLSSPIAEQRAVVLGDGESLIVDVSESLKPDILGWSAKRSIPVLDKVPHVGKLFQNVGDHAPDRRYLLITPRILVPE